jgi:hypothetical protein
MEKKIYTSNYARKGADPMALAISAWPPPWYEGKGLNILAPTRQLVLDVINNKMDLDEYTEAYIDLLEERIPDPQKVLDEIPDGSFLLCYEKADDTCHRHIMRDWFFEKTGFIIEEWKNEKEQKEADQQGIVEDLLEL